MSVKDLIDKAALENELTKEEMINILNVKDKDNLDYLFIKAEDITSRYCGEEIQIRGIIEFSNYCRCKCAYCGLNRSNNHINRYRMDLDEIIETAKKAYDAGYKTIVLQSGEDLWYTKDKICNVIKNIKKIGDLSITLSIGERKFEEYKAFKEAGGDRFLIKHETADKHIYNKLHHILLLIIE